MEVLALVETATVVTTFLLFASGITVCVDMHKTKNTSSVPFVFFVVNIFVSVIGLYYGRLTDNALLVIINGVGTLLWTIYTLVFMWVCRQRTMPTMQLTTGGVLLLSHFLYVHSLEGAVQIDQLGFIMFIWGNIVLLTPSIDIIHVIKQKSSDDMSLSLLIGGTLCSVTWLIYGYLIKDAYVYAPNIPGLVVSFLKVVALVYYRGGSKKHQ